MAFLKLFKSIIRMLMNKIKVIKMTKSQQYTEIVWIESELLKKY